MKIAMINNSRGWGGAEQMLLSLALRLRDRGHQVGVFLRKGSVNAERFTSSGLDIWHVPRSLTKTAGGIAAMISTVRKHKFDLIHVHRNHDLVVGKIVALAAGKPLLLTQHCQLGSTSSLLINLADRIVAVSHFIGADMEARFPVLKGKLKVVHNGIDLAPFSNPTTGYWQGVAEVAGATPLLGVVGYFYKNQEELIGLMPRIREHLPQAKLVIIGSDDDKKPFLEQKALESGVTDAVYFAGRIPHERIGDALAGLDFNVSAFRREGCALNVIEALSVGTPFVGYRAGSYPELVQDEITGILAEDGNKFVARLVALVAEPQKIAAMRVAARNDAFARFSLDRMVDVYEQEYRLLGGIDAG